uniref:Interferon a3-like n=1 Tax=Fundulus heteroclitus TaxID=8078 RepID=A0A3Q2T643_FUNHE
MLSRIFFACALLALFCACSPLSWWWMDHKFRQYSENSLNLLDMMAYHHVSQDAEVNTEPFPHHLYNQASRASAEVKLAFTVQILREVSALFEEDDSSSSWQEITVDHFLNIVNKQADELQLCVSTSDRQIFNMFDLLIPPQGHRIEAWERIRREVKDHLIRVDRLVSSLFTSN